MLNDYQIKHAGDRGISIEFKNEISEETNQKVAQLKKAIEKNKITGVEHLIPTYRALLLQYNPSGITFNQLKKIVSKLVDNTGSEKPEASKVYIIPVCYEDHLALDLKTVAEHNHLSCEEVINIHTAIDYRIYMLGFTPGFPYLGGMDKRIETPRLAQPRTLIEAGSVGIAGGQTGIYPINSPGGWQIIGRTPLKLFDKNERSPILLEAGCYIRFKSVSMEEYNEISKKIDLGVYKCEIILKGGKSFD